MSKYQARWLALGISLSIWALIGFMLLYLTSCANTHWQTLKQQHEESQLYKMV